MLNSLSQILVPELVKSRLGYAGVESHAYGGSEGPFTDVTDHPFRSPIQAQSSIPVRNLLQL